MDMCADSEGKRSSLKITLIYFIFGSVWIIFSDRILAAFVSDPKAMTAIQTYKGWFYVTVTAALVYVLVSGMEKRLRQLLSQLDRKNKNLHQEMQMRIEKEKHICDLMKDLEAKNKELESIIYVSSHDLRSPLINIQGFTGELAKNIELLKLRIADCPKAGSDEQTLHLLEQDIPDAMLYIRTSADKLSMLQQGLLQVCRLGYESMNPRTVDMNELLNKAAGSLKFQAGQCGATIELGPLPNCRADEGKLLQVFVNLIGNALKYRDPKNPPVISVTGSQADEKAVYRVTDNGIGIDPRYHKKVFEMYHQLDPDFEGQGLGLTIVKRILDRMNGTITLDSEPGKGTTFTVTLPTE